MNGCTNYMTCKAQKYKVFNEVERKRNNLDIFGCFIYITEKNRRDFFLFSILYSHFGIVNF